MPQMVWMCTPDGLNIYFNQQWVDYTGLTLEESYGTGWITPFHPDDQKTAGEAWDRATRTGETYRVESRLRAADGRYRWFLMKGEPLVDARGADRQVARHLHRYRRTEACARRTAAAPRASRGERRCPHRRFGESQSGACRTATRSWRASLIPCRMICGRRCARSRGFRRSFWKTAPTSWTRTAGGCSGWSGKARSRWLG